MVRSKKFRSKAQKGGSPAYRLHGELGLLNQSSLNYQEVPLTVVQNGHSDHIVHTSGGGRCGSGSMRKSRRKGRGRSKRGRGRSKRGLGGTVVLRLARKQKVKTIHKPVKSSSMLKKNIKNVITNMGNGLSTQGNTKTNRLAPKKPYKYSFERK